MLNIDFGSASDNNLQPWSLCGCIGQDPQETWVTQSVATFVECINDKDKSVLQVVRKGADEVKEESAIHQLQSKVWVVTKVFCYNGSKRREEHCEHMDESGKDIFGLAQIWVVPLAEKGTSKVVSFIKVCTD